MDGTKESVTMLVKPGSKVNNLLPFALEAFRNKACRKIIWRSLQGATTKTVTCAEQFKQNWLSSSSSVEPDTPDRPDQQSVNSELFQNSRIFLQKRDVIEAAARIQYTLEESALEVTISKDPIPDTDSSQHVTMQSKFTDFVPVACPTEDKSTSRRRIGHTKKRKRETQPTDPEKPTKPSKKLKRGPPRPQVVESTVPGSLAFPSPRLAPGFEAVNKSCIKSKPSKKN